MEEEIENLGKGALPDTPDHRDFTAELILGAGEPVLWSSSPLGRPEAENFNQRSSSSCVGCGSRNLHWQLTGKDYSRRDIYSRIFLPGGGAYLRDGVKVICDIGNQTQDECPDPDRPTESKMREKSKLPDSSGADDKELSYFVIKNNSIDAVAQAIRDYGGCTLGVKGSDEGWQNKTNPRPPQAGEDIWSHCIEAFDYFLKDGKKTIICKSSWCGGSHHIHYINEDYFASGNTFNGWCIIPKKEMTMTNSILVKRQVGDSWEYGFFDPDTAPDALISDMRNRGIQPPLKEDGTLDWDRVENMISGVIVSNK